MAEIGDRVGVVFGRARSRTTGDAVVLVGGAGTYLGTLPLGPEARGQLAALMREVANESGEIPFNAAVDLDMGGRVWGCECWWGPLTEVEADLARWTAEGQIVMQIDVATYRQQEAGDE